MTYTLKPNRAKFDHAMNGGDGEYCAYPEASGQSFKAGQLVYLAAGLTTVVADAGVVIWGIAESDASTSATTTPTIDMNVLRMGDVVSIKCSGTPTYANIGIKYELVASSNVTLCNLSGVSTPCMTVVGVVDPGVSGGRVLVTFLPTVLQYHIGS